MRSKLLIYIFSLAAILVFSLAIIGLKNKSENKKKPVLKWTANHDPMNFRYDFLENIEDIALYTATKETGTWNHHTYITYFKGVVYASWDQHKRDENGPGQHGLMRRSMDHGKTWTEVEVLFPPLAKKVPAAADYPYTRFQTSNGFIVVDDLLYAITDVADWTKPGAKKGKPRIKIGRMCRPVNPDGTLGEIFWLLPQAPEPVEGFPAFPAGEPGLVEKIHSHLRKPGSKPQLSFGEGNPVSDDNHATGEPVTYQLSNGTWVKVFRDNGSKAAESFRETEASKSRRLYASFSLDDGQTWTTPTRTSFPDACGRTSPGKLPDGQVYLINAGWPLSNKKGGRTLQSISLSKDGLNFDRYAVLHFLPPPKRFKGRSKREGYQSHSVVAEDNLWILTSVNKEDIQLTRIPLEELYKL